MTPRLFANRQAPAASWGHLFGLRNARPSDRRRGRDGERAGDVLLALENGPQATSMLAMRLGISRQAVQRHLTNLQARGAVVREGNNRASRWRLP